jgi:hypothetical protein
MKRIIIAAVASTIGGAAFAGGLGEPVQAPVIVAPAIPAAYDWSGGYGGIQIGGMDGDLRLSGENLENNNTTSNKFGISGATFGLFAGYH